MSTKKKLFPSHVTPDFLNERGENTLISHIGIIFTEVGDRHLTAEMPVDARTKQPAGILHGGASVVLAETLGSAAAQICVDAKNQITVGMEINTNHIKSISEGMVIGVTTPIHIGRSTHVWGINIKNEKDQLIAISRITVAVLNKKT